MSSTPCNAKCPVGVHILLVNLVPNLCWYLSPYAGSKTTADIGCIILYFMTKLDFLLGSELVQLLYNSPGCFQFKLINIIGASVVSY